MPNYFDNIYSIDFETFGLRPSDDLVSGGIWSIGMSSNDKKIQREIFVKQNSNMNTTSTIKALGESSEFNASQLAKGRFESYRTALATQKTMHSSQAIASIFSEMSPNAAILIQNVNFEQQFLKSVLSNMDPQEAQKIKDSFMFKQTLDTNEVLHRPPSVTRSHVAARESFANFRNAKDIELKNKYFESARKHYGDVVGEYKKLLNSKSGAGGRFVIELQDITEAVYAEAAARGHLDKNYLLTGRRVSFLTDILLKETETHTALSDTIQQNQIFSRMMQMHEELVSGQPISQTSKELLSVIRKRQPEAALQEFTKAVTRARTDINTTGSTRINLAMLDRHSLVTMQGPFGDESTYVRQYKYIDPSKEGQFVTRSEKRALDDVRARFTGLVPETLMEKIISSPGDAQVQKIVAEASSFAEDRGQATAAAVAEHKIESVAEKAREKVSSMSSGGRSKKIALGIIGAIGAGLALSTSSKSEIEESKRRYEHRMDVKNQMSRFSSEREPLIYHGTGLQNYKERNKHHQY